MHTLSQPTLTLQSILSIKHLLYKSVHYLLVLHPKAISLWKIPEYTQLYSLPFPESLHKLCEFEEKFYILTKNA